MIPFLVIVAQLLTVTAGSKTWDFTVNIPTDVFTECFSTVVSLNARHLYCMEGEIMYSGDAAIPAPLTDCATTVKTTFERQITCREGVRDFVYSRAFMETTPVQQ